MQVLNLSSREKEILDNEIDETAKSHDLIRDENGTLRFVQTYFPKDRGRALRDIWSTWEIEDRHILAFYRSIGYSVGGYCEILQSLSEG